MLKVAREIRHITKRIGNQRTRGQALVEFAMISILLFFLLFGILEMGRMMFIWSQLASAAQEGARYGMIHPREIIDPCCQGGYPALSTNGDPCNIVYQARARLVLVPTNTVGVEVGYDNAQGVPAPVVHPFDFSPITFHPTDWRVVVTTTYEFHFVVGILDTLLPSAGLHLSMVAARTIQSDEPNAPPQPPYCPDGEP